MRSQYSSETRKLQVQSEMDSLDLTLCMHNNDIKNARIRLTRIIDRINSLAPKLPAGFGDDAHKTRYLRRSVMGQDRAQTPISHIATSRYSFLQFITALEKVCRLVRNRHALERGAHYSDNTWRIQGAFVNLTENKRTHPLAVHARASS